MITIFLVLPKNKNLRFSLTVLSNIPQTSTKTLEVPAAYILYIIVIGNDMQRTYVISRKSMLEITRMQNIYKKNEK